MKKKVNCWGCGKEITVDVEEYYNPYKLKNYDKEWNARKNKHKREYCKECRAVHSSSVKKDKELYKEIGTRLMMERAVRIMEIQNINVYEYREAIQAVQENFKTNTDRFRSAEEIVATIILIQHEIGVKNNFKLGAYTADIYIQSLSCIVEIDGYMHNNDSVKFKDGNKDIYIRQLLGGEWEVVRIPTKYIHEKAENLISAIIEVKSRMMELRKENGGLLPYNFSRSMDAVYRKILKG